MNAEVMTFYFTETINAFQMAVEGITIQEAADRSSATHYNLTTASTKPSTDPNWIVRVNLGKADVDAIKVRISLYFVPKTIVSKTIVFLL